jgi:hypothetical protein
MSGIAKGAFDVDMVPAEEPSTEDGVSLVRMTLAKTFSGDLDGTSDGQMLTARTPVEGSAGYVAIERVSGKLHGRTGTFVLQHSGLMSAAGQELSITVVPDSGTGELSGISGEFRLAFTEGAHQYELEYTLPDR